MENPEPQLVSFTHLIVTFLLSSGILTAIGGFIFKRFIGGIDDVVNEVKGLREDMHEKALNDKDQDGIIQRHEDKLALHDRRLDSHSRKIEKLQGVA